jgi:hypothetical protein
MRQAMATNLKAIGTMLTLWIMALVLQTGMGEAQNGKSQQTWQGFVTDTHCGTNCQVTKNMTPDKKCVDRCVREGSKYGLWVGNHVYTLEPQSKAARYAARDVTVTGTLDGETIHINSIEPGTRGATEKSTGR